MSLHATIRSIERVCDVAIVCGSAADPQTPCDVLCELPHGATEAHHIAEAQTLTADYPEGYDDLFWVNTDQGSPEYGRRFAEQITDPAWIERAAAALLSEDQRRAATSAAARRKVLLIRALVPRTIVDFNRVWDLDTAAFRAANLTGAVAPFARPSELEAIRARYDAYQALVDQAHAEVCGRGGFAFNLHTYAPITVSINNDESILAAVKRAYIPENYPTYPKRPPGQLITKLPGEPSLTDEALTRLIVARYADANTEIALDDPFTMHKATSCYVRAAAYAGQVTVLELRRDLLADTFAPFTKWAVPPEQAEQMAAPLALAFVMRSVG